MGASSPTAGELDILCLIAASARAARLKQFFSIIALSFTTFSSFTTIIATSVSFTGSSSSLLSEAKGLSLASRAISECFPLAIKETIIALP
jgi:hypothetical protein